MLLTAAGQDTADLQNQRLEAMDSLSQKLDVTFNTSSNGDVTVHTTNGTLLPTRPDQIGLSDSNTELPSSSWPLTYAATTISSSMYYKEGIPPAASQASCLMDKMSPPTFPVVH